MGKTTDRIDDGQLGDFLEREAEKLCEFCDNALIFGVILEKGRTRYLTGAYGCVFASEEMARSFVAGEMAPADETVWLQESLKRVLTRCTFAVVLVNAFKPPSIAWCGAVCYGNPFTINGVVRDFVVDAEECVRIQTREDEKD
jgi:hypothetical protein